MATIRLKKRASSGSAGAPSSLAPSEVAFNEADKVLYYGYGDAGDGTSSSIISVAGVGAVMHLGNVNQTAAGNKTFSGNVVVSGNLTVNGTTSTLNTTNSVVKDSLIELGNGTSGTPSNDAGLVIERGSSNNAFIGWDESLDQFHLGTGTFTGSDTGNLSITTGTLKANLSGNVTGNVTGNTSGSSGSCTGNAATATALANGRSITQTGEVTWAVTGFDGSGNVTGASTIADNVVDEANLKVSNSPTNGYYLQAQSGNSGGLTWAAVPDSTNASALTSGTLPAARIADDSIVEAKLDIHNAPTDGYALKYSSANGLVWEDAGTATNASNVTVSANNSNNETVYITFVDGATGTQGVETDTGLNYNPSSGALTSTSFVGSLTGAASSAATLTTARTIAGVSFNGSANISLNNNAITNGAGYVTSSIINSLSASNLSSGTIPSARVGTIDGGTF